MLININIDQFENEILNPLNRILLLSHGTKFYKDVRNEINRIMVVLIDSGLARTFRKDKGNHGAQARN